MSIYGVSTDQKGSCVVNFIFYNEVALERVERKFNYLVDKQGGENY